MHRAYKILATWLLMVLTLLPWQSYGQQSEQKLYSQQELEQLVAPIALYPDPLLAQILMASTYPLEIVTADRWIKANPNLKDKALEDALQQQTWDPSVKSLTAVPDVLNMLNEKIDMTTKLGDAFLAQQKDVLNAVQVLRSKAQTAGNLKSSKEQVVNIAAEEETSTTQSYYQEGSEAPNIITIEPATPDVIYVPTYDPSVVYGSWPYPDYPPYSYYPSGYYAAGTALSFATGVFVGGALWGNCNWRRGEVNVNVNQFNRFNHANINNNNWHHDPNHRHGVPYRDRASQERFAHPANTQARDAFRGQAEQGRAEMARQGQNAIQRMDREGQRREQQANSARNLSPADQRLNPQNRQNIPDNRHPEARHNAPEHHVSPNRGTERPNAFADMHRGGGEMQHFSNRGAASRGYHGGNSSFRGNGGGFHGSGGGHGGGPHGGGGHGGGGRHR